jgi:hypothetical protein
MSNIEVMMTNFTSMLSVQYSVFDIPFFIFDSYFVHQ